MRGAGVAAEARGVSCWRRRWEHVARAFHCSDGSVSDFCERRGSPLIACWPSSVPRTGAAQARQAGCFVCALLPGEPVTETTEEGYLNGHRPLRIARGLSLVRRGRRRRRASCS